MSRWDTLIHELRRVVEENNSAEQGEKKSLSQIFSEFAKKHNVTTTTVSYHYYAKIKPKEQKEQSLDVKEDDLFVGKVVDVEVVKILDRGALCKLGDNKTGLIHISEIDNKYVFDVEQYFYIGEKLKAKIIGIDENRYALSTKAIGGKEKVTQVINTEQKEILPQQPTNEFNNMLDFIKKYSNNHISKTAYDTIQEMVNAFGIFNSTIALVEVVRDIDFSKVIVEMAIRRLNQQSVRQRSP